MNGSAPFPPPQPESPFPMPAPPPEPYPFWGYLDLLLLAALAIPMMVLAHYSVYLFFFFLNWTPPKALAPLTETFLFSLLWLLTLYLIIETRYMRPFWRAMAWVRGRWRPGAALGSGVALAAVCIALAYLLNPPQAKTPLEEMLRDHISLVLAGIYAITLAPICEELAFRGFLMPLLVRSFGVPAGILLQAVPFAVLHGAEYNWTWQLLIIIFVAGVAFGIVRQRTGSTAASSLMHAGYNLVFFSVMLAQRLSTFGKP